MFGDDQQLFEGRSKRRRGKSERIDQWQAFATLPAMDGSSVNARSSTQILNGESGLLPRTDKLTSVKTAQNAMGCGLHAYGCRIGHLLTIVAPECSLQQVISGRSPTVK